MAMHKQLHLFEAKSADVRISKDQPTVARVNFSLVDGEFLAVEIPRYVLESPSKASHRSSTAL